MGVQKHVALPLRPQGHPEHGRTGSEPIPTVMVEGQLYVGLGAIQAWMEAYERAAVETFLAQPEPGRYGEAYTWVTEYRERFAALAEQIRREHT